jgi:hypothetical protein
VTIKAQTTQLTLDFEPGLTERHLNLRACVAAGIYRRGLSKCAIELNESPGNLTNQLGNDSPRKFGVDDLEVFLEKSKDYEAIYYLIEKFLHRPDVQQSAALAQLPMLLAQVQAVMKAAGVSA